MSAVNRTIMMHGIAKLTLFANGMMCSRVLVYSIRLLQALDQFVLMRINHILSRNKAEQ